MDVTLGRCGLVLAFLFIFFGMAEVGLWVACYFECPTGQEIEFNYFASAWTGVLAFTVGFMIIVLFCVKFKSLGTFITILAFLLVPCEILCACIYAYRAYLSRPTGNNMTGNLSMDYFSVFLFSAMAVGGVFLFFITIMWNCYYCCVATPVEDFEEEVKEDLEEEEERQNNLRSVQDSVFVDNPVVDDESRSPQNRPLHLGQEPSHFRYPYSFQNGYQQAVPPRQSSRYQNSDNRRDNRNPMYQQTPPIRDDYPYPSAFGRKHAPQERNRRNRQQSRMPRPNLGSNHQSYIRNENDRGQVNRGYEADELGQPVDRSYNLRSYIYDGVQGNPFDDPVYSGEQPVYSEQPRRLTHQHPNASAEYSRGHNESRRHVNRPPNYSPQRNTREPVSTAQPREEDRSFIYRPRPENYRGKPPKPEYMQQQQTARNSGYPTSAQNPGPAVSNTRGAGPVNAYF